jgi:hypothetical protein
MQKWIVATGLFLSLALACSGFSEGTRAAEVEKLMNGLSSAGSGKRIQTAKVITQSGIEDQALYEKIAALLTAGYKKVSDPDHVDEMSWLCKALSASGDPKYTALLQEIAKGSSSTKLKHYAEQSIDMIEEYAARIQILQSTETWNDNLSIEENRLLNMLNADNIQLKKDAAKIIVRSIQVDEKVYEVVGAELLGMLANSRLSSQEVDTMAWLCKALAASGNSKYGETLRQVKTGTQNQKLSMYASRALKQID